LITNTVWYKYTPSSNVTLSADTFGSESNFDTVLNVLTGPASSPTFGALTLVGCNDDSGGTTSQVVFGATGGTTYYFQAGGVAGGAGLLTFPPAVRAGSPPANNNFPSAVNASPLPYTNSQAATAGATLEPAEQRPCGGQIGATVWYKHTPSTGGTLTASTAGSGYDTVLAVYSGSSLPTLTMLSCDDDSLPGKKSQLSLNVVDGTNYYIQAGGFDNASGNLTFNLSFIPAADSDGDGWSDAAETTIGTDPLDACPDNEADNAWPADINNDALLDVIGDISALTNSYALPVPPAPARFDIAPEAPDGFIDVIGDISRLTGLFGTSCTQ